MQIFPRWRPWLDNAEDTLNLEHQAGWNALVVETIDTMVEAVKPDGRFAIRQIKQKFGGLRLYTFDARLGPIARSAEERSFTICEVCGAPGRVREERSWYRTVCDEHRPRLGSP